MWRGRAGMIAMLLAPVFLMGAVTSAATSIPSGHEVLSALEACLHQSIGNVVVRGEPSYNQAKQCRNTRVDIVPSPVAVVRVSNEDEVQAAVRCAAAHSVQACARAGAHGFENAAGCSGGLTIDLQDLQDLTVEPSSQVVRFGAGHTLGQLYYKLKTDHDLVVPGGAESGVGAAGLFLGCGRGMLTQLHGLACDTIQGIRYVDARGEIQVADGTTNPDMLWMARGGGGEFPGIVTEFVVQAFPAPRLLHARDCTFPHEKAKALIRTWASHLEEISDPVHQMFTHITMWNSRFVNFPNLCFDCSPEQIRWFEAKVDEIAEAVGDGHCHSFAHTWFDQLLFEAGRDHGVIENTPAALMDRNQGYGAKGPARASKNGGYLADSYNVSEEMLDTLTDWTFGHMDKPHPWSLLVLIYNLGGQKITEVPASSAAYGGRSSKFVVHFKHQWNEESLTDHADLMQHHHDMSVALERHLPCKSFYNYMDGNMPCAKGDWDSWLRAFFSDVGRMQQIKVTADPQGVFQSHLLPKGVAPASHWPQHVSLISQGQIGAVPALSPDLSLMNLSLMVGDIGLSMLDTTVASNSTRVPAASADLPPKSVGQPSEHALSAHMNFTAVQGNDGEPSQALHSEDGEQDEDSSDTGAGLALAIVAAAAVVLSLLGVLFLAHSWRRQVMQCSAPAEQPATEQPTSAGSFSTGTLAGAAADRKLTFGDLAADPIDEDKHRATRSASRRSTGAETFSTAADEDLASDELGFWPSTSSACSTWPSEGAEGAAAPDVRIAVA